MIQQLNEYITSNISDKRCIHIKGVCDTVVRLAEIYGVDQNQALIAGLLHDITKEMSLDFHLKYLTKAELKIVSKEPLMHGFSAVEFSKEKFGIEDEEIFEAIRYHTITSDNMSDLGKILFIADFCEPNRNFTEAKLVSNQFGIELNTLFNQVVKYSYEFYESKGIENHQNLRNLYLKI